MTKSPIAIAPLLFAVAVVFGGCAEDTPGLFVRANVPFDDECQVQASASTDTFRGLGSMDLFITQRYVMAPVIESTLVSSETVSFGATGGGAGLSGTDWEANSVSLERAVVRYDVPDALGIELLNGIELPLSGAVDPGGFIGVELEPINESVGRILARSEFLRTSGVPLTMNLRVTIHGRTVAGREIESNEFVYPIQLCYGCLFGIPSNVIDPNYFIQPNCRLRNVVEDDTEGSIVTGTFSTDACFPGQDEAVDCRVVCPTIAGTELDPDGICGSN